MSQTNASGACFLRCLPATSVWLVELIVVSLVIGLLFGGLVNVLGSPKITIVAMLGLGALTGVAAAYMAKGLRIPFRSILILGAIFASFFASYGYLVSRIGGLYGWEIIPWSPLHLYVLWPEVSDGWVEVDRVTGEETAADSSDIEMLRLGLAITPLLALVICPIAAAMTRGGFAPFCYGCRRWLDKPTNVYCFEPPSSEMAEEIEKSDDGQFLFFEFLTPCDQTTTDRIEMAVHRCPDCGQMPLVNVQQFVNTGEKEPAKIVIGKWLTIDDDLLNRLQIAHETPASPPEFDGAEPIEMSDDDAPAGT